MSDEHILILLLIVISVVGYIIANSYPIMNYLEEVVQYIYSQIDYLFGGMRENIEFSGAGYYRQQLLNRDSMKYTGRGDEDTDVYYRILRSLPLQQLNGRMIKIVCKDIPAAFEAPDWMRANYNGTIKNASRNPQENYNRLVKDIVFAQKRKQSGGVAWGANSGPEGRLTAATFKLAGVSQEMQNIITSHTNTYAFDWGCGDSSMGSIFGQHCKLKMVFGDIENVIFKGVTLPFVKISLTDGVNISELANVCKRFKIVEITDNCNDSVSNVRDVSNVHPSIITMMHSIHHFENDTDPRYCPDAIVSNVRRARDILQDDGMLLIREHDVGLENKTSTSSDDPHRNRSEHDDRGKIATVCLTHIKYEKDESSTNHIVTEQDAKAWLNNYRLGLTSAPRMCAIIESCGFKLVSSTSPTGKDFSYYALFRKV